MTKKELAEAMGVQAQTVSGWIRKGFIQKKDDYDLEEVKSDLALKRDSRYLSAGKSKTGKSKAVREKIIEITGAAEKGLLSREKAEELIANLKAELLQLELDKAKGELVNREQVNREHSAVIMATKNQFLNIPDRIAGLLSVTDSQVDCRRMLKEEINNVLLTLGQGDGGKCPA